MFSHELHKLFMLQMASRADNDVARYKALRIKFAYWNRSEALDGFLRSQNRPAQSMVLPKILSKDFVDEVIRIVLIHFDFFENHTAFTFNVFWLEDRMEH